VTVGVMDAVHVVGDVVAVLGVLVVLGVLLRVVVEVGVAEGEEGVAVYVGVEVDLVALLVAVLHGDT